MRVNFYRRRYLLLWQLIFLVAATSWLWAPQLNHALSSRANLISQYEVPSQPYSWLFRAGDLIAGALVVLMAAFFLRTAGNEKLKKRIGWLLLAIGIGMISDPLISAKCHMVGKVCQEYVSPMTILHLAESFFTATVVFVTAAYDAYKRRKIVSAAAAAVIFLYGLTFIDSAVRHQDFNTLIQYIYELSLLVWLAWFCRDFLVPANFRLKNREPGLVKNITAAWAFLNGVTAIVLSLAHIHLLGKIRGIYFAGDSAWLAEHAVLVGVALIYISRHLLRGERRARQIFLGIAAMEVLKYALISPQAALLLLYSLTFIALFIFRDDFNRGTVPITWSLKVKDALYTGAGLAVSAIIALLALDRDDRVSRIASRTFDNIFDYAGNKVVPSTHLRSVLLAQTITVFLAAGMASLLWILFRPYKIPHHRRDNYKLVEQLLARHSRSSEDFFKLWPKDKRYFWNSGKTGFIAYKIVGSAAYALADPIGKNRQMLINEFIAWARGRRLKACFLPVYPGSAGLYSSAGLELIQIGSSAIITIEDYINDTSNDKWWRWQKNRAEKKGYEYGFSEPPHRQALLKELKHVSDAWLKTGGHIERGFALGYFDKDYIDRCRLHYIKDKSGALVAFVNEPPQYGKRDTATIDLLRYTPGSNNAMPYLIFKTIQNKKEAGIEIFDLGFVPFARAKGSILTIAKALGGGRFSAAGLEQFKNKFDPDWQPNHIAYDGDMGDLAVIALNLEKSMEA